jgi:hypothetical protein
VRELPGVDGFQYTALRRSQDGNYTEYSNQAADYRN